MRALFPSALKQVSFLLRLSRLSRLGCLGCLARLPRLLRPLRPSVLLHLGFLALLPRPLFLPRQSRPLNQLNQWVLLDPLDLQQY